jgi:GTP-binding protein
MIVKTARFIISNTSYKKCPEPVIPEYAFIGRSNVGKSSLINMLTNNKNLAKISVKPGKTQLINHFIINDDWYLVDLPGYGYAKTSKKNRELWSGFLKEYLLKRQNLVCIFVLIDSRIKPQKIDLEFMYQLAMNRLPFAIVFTKTDKISGNQVAINVNDYFTEMKKVWETLPSYFISSSLSKKGREEILEYIEQLNHSEVSEEIRKTEHVDILKLKINKK